MPSGKNATQKNDSRTKCHREINIPGQNAMDKMPRTNLPQTTCHKVKILNIISRATGLKRLPARH